MIDLAELAQELRALAQKARTLKHYNHDQDAFLMGREALANRLGTLANRLDGGGRRANNAPERAPEHRMLHRGSTRATCDRTGVTAVVQFRPRRRLATG